MSSRDHSRSTSVCFLLVLAAAITLAACGGGNNTTTTPVTPVANSATAEVNSGPGGNSTNMLFVSVNVCMPGSTTNCQTIDHVQVDTGSYGLRVLSSALGSLDPSTGNSSGLPTIQDSSNNVLQECVQFADSTYAWGPVAVADVSISGEKASSVPFQVISANPLYSVPSSCLQLGNGGSLGSQSALMANGIIGVGVFPDDCGASCTASSSSVPNEYYLCPSGKCSVATVQETNQVANPVVYFPSDNNGVVVTLPDISADGVASASGSITFGIGTQSDNALGSAKVFTVDGYGEFASSYGGVSYPGYLDTGSNGLFFLDGTTAGIADCGQTDVNFTGWYCPGSPVQYTVTNTGANGTTGQAQFSIANTITLFTNGSGGFFAFNDLGGAGGTDASNDIIDLGLPFFYGKSVFVGIMGQTAPSNATNTYGYFAY